MLLRDFESLEPLLELLDERDELLPEEDFSELFDAERDTDLLLFSLLSLLLRLELALFELVDLDLLAESELDFLVIVRINCSVVLERAVLFVSERRVDRFILLSDVSDEEPRVTVRVAPVLVVVLLDNGEPPSPVLPVDTIGAERIIESPSRVAPRRSHSLFSCGNCPPLPVW